MFFKGDYSFFDYKYNIEGYNGQDFGSFPQYFYLIISVILMVVLLILTRKIKKEKVLTIIRIVSIFWVILYIVKTVWESVYDIKIGGSFNYGLLPFDTCSIPMLAGLLASFSSGRLKKYAEGWLVTGSIIGGLGTMVVLNAFKYYPFFSFGAFYSMIWHFLMVFLGLLLIITNYVPMSFKVVLRGYLLHVICSAIVIPIDYIYNFDFMLYKDLGGIPIFEDIASIFTNNNLSFLNPIMMLILYFLAFCLIWIITIIVKRIGKRYGN